MIFQDNGENEPSCWFDTSMTSTVAGFLILKSSMYSNTTHSLNIAITPSNIGQIGLSLFNTQRTSFNEQHQVQGAWVKRGNENQSNQFQLFRVPFKDLQRNVPQSLLQHIYRSYVRLQEYCPNIIRKNRLAGGQQLNIQRRPPVSTREAKVFFS